MSYTLAYDEENRIETVTDTQASQTWTFHYDGNGTRVRQVNPDGSQLLLLNGGRYHVEIAADSTESTTRYYSIAGQRPAMRNNDGSINYLLGDHLGSVSTVVNANGEIVNQSRYLPFSELLWEDGNSPTDYTYTGQRSLSEIGLMDYNARFYDPMLGRFTSPDKLIPNPTNSQDLNRFSYVRNNPIRYTDPSGNKILIDDDGMTVRYDSSGNKVIVNGGFTFPRAEKAIANYYLTGNDNYINYGLSGYNAQFVAKAVQNTEILMAKSMIIHTEDEKDEEENSLIEFQYKLMGWALIFPTLYDFKLPTSNYPVDTEFNIYKRSENISNAQLFPPISTGAQAAIDLRGLSTPSKRSNRVFENQLTTDEAKTWFDRIADPGTVQPMNKVKGGFTGNVQGVEGAIINYRPYSSSPPFGSTIDIHGLPGFDSRTEIKFLGGIK